MRPHLPTAIRPTAASMDRNCAGYLNIVAEALLMPGSPIFKF
jgi:hypothetical protein